MAKHTLKILRCQHRKILKVFLTNERVNGLWYCFHSEAAVPLLIQQTVLKMKEKSYKMSMVESVLETKIHHLACYIFQ